MNPTQIAMVLGLLCTVVAIAAILLPDVAARRRRERAWRSDITIRALVAEGLRANGRYGERV